MENSNQEAESYQQELLAVLVLQPSKTIQKPILLEAKATF